MKPLIIIVLSIWFAKAFDLSPDLQFLPDDLIETINSNAKNTWKAGKNFEGISLSGVKKLFMSSKETLIPIKDRELHYYDSSSTFDARTKWPNCTSIGQIYDQGFCSPSWIYASVGQMADRICIKTGKNIDVKSTVENMMKGNYDCDSKYNSADTGKAFRYWSKKGIFIVKPDQSSQQCPFQMKIDDEYFDVDYYNTVGQAETKQEIQVLGPLTFHINVYLDLLYYKSGVYQRTSDVNLGTHAVKVIGWGTENDVDYWLIANSWGTKWGDKGFFKLKRGVDELGINQNSASATLEQNANVPPTIDKEQLFLVLSTGSINSGESLD